MEKARLRGSWVELTVLYYGPHAVLCLWLVAQRHANIKVIFTSKNETFELEGKIKETAWTDVYCDLSKFRGINNVDSVKILFFADENYYDSPQALITSLRAYSTKYDDAQLDLLLNPVAPEEELVRSLRKYLYPALILILAVSSAVLVYRRTSYFLL